MKQWNEFYSEHGIVMENPSSDMEWLIPMFRKRDITRVLDIGCGTGRNAVHLANQGFDVYAVDSSNVAVNKTKELAGNTPLDIRIASIFDLPFEDRFFDALLCRHVLQYNDPKNYGRAVNEMKRVTKNEGLVYVRVVSDQHMLAGKKPDELPEGFSQGHWMIKHGYGVHFFNKGELELLFKDYTIMRLEHRIGKPTEKLQFPLYEWLLLAETPKR